MQTPEDQEGALSDSPDADWFRRAFDTFYLDLYANRDHDEAALLIGTLRRFGLRGPVLDVACGAGRFLHVLAADGERAAGVDLSRPLLDHARRTLGRGLQPLARADMRRLPIRSASQAWALLLFTSFGYFESRDEDLMVLREISRVLQPGGGFALDFLNAREAVLSLVPESTREIGGRSVRESRAVDPAGPFLRKRVEVGPGRDGSGPAAWDERVRLYSHEDLVALLYAADLAVASILGDYHGSAFEEERSPRCLLIARKGRRL